MDHCKNVQQTTCKKKFMSYWGDMGRIIDVLYKQSKNRKSQTQMIF